MNNTLLIIPAYQPDSRLLTIVRDLAPRFLATLVVNDGSSAGADIFASLRALPRVTVLDHDVNRGKGAALKTAFTEATALHSEADGVVTADADGQHLPEDILRVADSVSRASDRITLGVRTFGPDVPLRSRFGNFSSSILFLLLTGSFIRDTQTGLRGIPMRALPRFADLPGDRYEYEIRALVKSVLTLPKPVQLPIRTIYIEGNTTSHFHPVRDSFRVMKTLFAAAFRERFRR